jgi:hypothetical protein
MSIFTETLSTEIFKQLRIREAIIEQGNNPTNTNRFGSPRSAIKVKNALENISIAAGAFYTNTVHRQCVIRMMSGVDIMSKSLLETNESPISNNLAKMFILEGGTLPFKLTPRGGFGKSGGAYGDSSMRANAGDGFGIVPMPGIIDAEIRTKTVGGSLREAKVNFICHNLRQLSALEILYMRPGMPVLLEWQWSPFIGNDGLINTTNYSVGSNWFNSTKTIANINNLIIENVTKSSGNYEGFVGFCKNFNIVSRTDGGYDCTTELVSSGEILEGLKSRREGYTTTTLIKTTTNDAGEVEETAYTADEITAHLNEIELDNMELILEGILELSKTNSRSLQNGAIISEDMQSFDSGKGEATLLDPTSTQAEAPGFWQTTVTGIENISGLVGALFSGNTANIVTEVVDISTGTNTQGVAQAVSRGASGALLNALNTTLTKFLGTGKVAGSCTSGGTYTDSDFLWQGETTGKETWYSYKTNQYNTYMSWKVLCDLINKLVFPLPNQSNPDEPLLKLVTYELKNGKNEFFKMTPYDFPTNRFTFGGENFGTLLDNSFDPSVCLMPWQNKDVHVSNYHDITKILLNVEYMLTKYREMAYKEGNPIENFNLYNFFDQIWKDVNTACAGNHKFVIHTNKLKSNEIRIIDLGVDTPKLTPAELFELKIQSNKSIVRDFNYSSTIPNTQTATTAIATLASKDANTLDQVTFANFSKGIKSRFHKESALTSKSGTTSPQDQYNKDFIKLSRVASKLKNYLKSIYGEEANQQLFGSDKAKNIVDGVSYQEVISTANSLKTILYSLLSRNPKGESLSSISLSRSSVIPLKFNCQLDGIGGLRIGDVFKVEKEKLPIGYQGKDIAFTITGESQEIKSNNDWTTEIAGQLILLDLTPPKVVLSPEEQLKQDIAEEAIRFNEEMAVTTFGADATAVNLSHLVIPTLINEEGMELMDENENNGTPFDINDPNTY